MAHELQMGDDGILRMAIYGDYDDSAAETCTRDFSAFVETSTVDKPLRILNDVRQAGKVSSKARRLITGMVRDPRVGKFAIVGVDRYARVLVSFLAKAAGQDSIRFFEGEEEALAWLKAGSQG